MSNEKHYDYYLVNAEESAAVHAIYKENIAEKRKEVQQELLDKTGAVAWRERANWGTPDFICELVYPRDSELILGAHIKHEQRDIYNGEKVVSVRGKLSSKAGRAFNEPMHSANKLLTELPDFPDWLVHVCYKINRTGLGGVGPKGHGICMLSTAGGFANSSSDQLAFRIPNDKEDNHGTVVIPASFQKISHGQWYDLVKGE